MQKTKEKEKRDDVVAADVNQDELVGRFWLIVFRYRYNRWIGLRAKNN